MKKIVLFFILALIIISVITSTQLNRPLQHIFIADKYPGGVGEIFGSARIVDSSMAKAGYVMRVPGRKLEVGSYQLVLEYSSDIVNFSFEVCREIYTRKLTPKNNSSILFGKHYDYKEDKRGHPFSCQNLIPITVDEIENGRAVAKFLIDKSDSFVPLDIRIRYNGTGELLVKKIYLSQDLKGERGNKVFRGVIFGIFISFLIILFLTLSKISLYYIEQIVIISLPLLLFPLYGGYTFYFLKELVWGEGLINLFVIVIILIFMLTIFYKNKFFKDIHFLDKLALLSIISITTYIVFFSYKLFSPEISLLIKSSSPQIWHFYFDNGDGDGFSEDSKVDLVIDSKNSYKDYHVKIPSNLVENVVIEIENISNENKQVKAVLKRLRLSNRVEYEEVIGRLLFNSIRPISNIVVSKQSSGAIDLIIENNLGSIELGNNLFKSSTHIKQQSIFYLYFLIFFCWLLYIFFLYKRYSNRIIEHIRSKEQKFFTITLLSSYMIIGVAMILVTGPPITSIYSQDLFTILDGLWREINGVHAHANYNSGVYGPLIFLPAFIGYIFDGHSGYIFTFGNAIVFVLITMCCQFVSTKRLSAVSSLFLSIYVGATAVGGHVLGAKSGQDHISMAMSYNRYGFALIAILLLLLFVKRKEFYIKTVKTEIAIGIILSLLLFLKLSFFIVAFFLMAGSYFVIKRESKETFVVIASFLIGSLIGLIYIRFSVFNMTHDFFHIINITGQGEGILTKLYDKTLLSLKEFLPLIASAILICLCSALSQNDKKNLILTLLASLMSGLLLLGSNYQFSEVPIFVVALLIVGDVILNKYLDNRLKELRIMFFSVLALLFISGYETMFKHVFYFIEPFRYKVIEFPKKADVGRFLSPYLNDIVVKDTIVSERSNEAFNLIKAYTVPGDTIFTLAHNNPVSFAMKLPLLINSSYHFWHYNYNFTLENHPRPALIFKGVDFILSKRKMTFLQYRLSMVYKPYIIKNYDLVTSTKHWLLYKKRVL